MGKWKQIAQEQEVSKQKSKWRQLAAPAAPQLSQSSPSTPGPGFVGTLQGEGGAFEGIKETVGNIPGSAYEYGESMVYPFVHPLKTAKSMVDLALGAIEKLPGGIYITGGQFDIVGKDNPREQAINTTIDYFVERYGSTEGFKDAVKKDPVGVTADFASLLTGGGGALRSVGRGSGRLKKIGGTIARAGGYAEPLNVLTMPLKGAKKLVPDTVSSRLYEGAAKFSTTLTTAQRNAIVKTALDKQIMPTFKGLRELSRQIEDLNVEIANVIDAAVTSGKKIPVSRLARGFNELKKNSRFSGKPRDAQRAVHKIKKQLVEANLTGKPGAPHLKKFSPQEAQKLKQNIYRELERYYSGVTDNDASVRAQQLVARNAKEAIEEIVPEIKQLNKKDGDLIALRKQIDKVAPRIANRDLLSLGTTAKAAGGGVAFGKVGLVTGLALGLLDSQPIIKARLALMVHKMQDRGIKVRMTPAVLRLMSYQTGEISQNLEK